MSQVYKLWRGKKIIPESIPLLDCVSHVMVHRAVKGHYQFLLGADIIKYKETIFCGWGNSKVNENDSASIMGGRRSADKGLTWSNFEKIAPGSKTKDAHSHGVFFSYKNNLYALVPRAEYGVFGAEYPNLRTELFVFDGKAGAWHSEDIVITGEQFWPVGRPELLDNGNFIIIGIICNNNMAEPAVAISEGENIRQWRVVQIPVPKRKDNWSEGGLIINGKTLQIIYRNGWKHSQRAQIAFSYDFGETWTTGTNTNIPMSPSKPCCGTLSNGQRYMVFNPAGNGRHSLAIAVSEPGKESFSKVWRIQHGASPNPRMKGCGKSSQWAYPMAYEYDNKLYVVYASSKEDCMLSIIPMDGLV